MRSPGSRWCQGSIPPAPCARACRRRRCCCHRPWSSRWRPVQHVVAVGVGLGRVQRLGDGLDAAREIVEHGVGGPRQGVAVDAPVLVVAPRVALAVPQRVALHAPEGVIGDVRHDGLRLAAEGGVDDAHPAQARQRVGGVPLLDARQPAKPVRPRVVAVDLLRAVVKQNLRDAVQRVGPKCAVSLPPPPTRMAGALGTQRARTREHREGRSVAVDPRVLRAQPLGGGCLLHERVCRRFRSADQQELYEPNSSGKQTARGLDRDSMRLGTLYGRGYLWGHSVAPSRHDPNREQAAARRRFESQRPKRMQSQLQCR